MKMNKLTTLTVMIALALGVTACNDDKNTAIKPTVAASVEVASAPDVKVDAVEATVENVELVPVKAAPVKVVAVEEKAAPKKEVVKEAAVKAKSDAKTLKIVETANGETTYSGTTTVTGTLEYNRTNNEELCEICFYFDEKSSKAIPKPTPDDNRPAIAIRYNDSEILDLSVSENECISVPMALEITDYIGVSGGNFGLARILKATKTGDVTVKTCS